MIRRHVVISGLVQGVWFRDSCQREARRLGIAGWVRNREDLRVEAVFEGPEDAVEAMISWSRQGPPRARVSSVAITPEPVEGEVGFTVR
jgi:acylphosphatase